MDNLVILNKTNMFGSNKLLYPGNFTINFSPDKKMRKHIKHTPGNTNNGEKLISGMLI